MKKFQLRMTALFLCLVMALTSAGCSQTEEKTDATTTTTAATTTSAEETTSASEEDVNTNGSEAADDTDATSATDATDAASGAESFLNSTSAEDLVSNYSYDEIYQQCQEAGLSVMPYSLEGDSMENGFVAYSFSGDGSSAIDFSEFMNGEVPEGFEDFFDGDMQGWEDFLNSGELPEGYEDLFEDFDLEDFEGFDFDPESDTAPAVFIETEDGTSYFGGLETVICAQFTSYEEALSYIDDTYGALTIEETDNGCVISGDITEAGITTTIDGAISADGLLYLTAAPHI